MNIKKLKKSIKFKGVEVIETSLIYSRVIVLQLTNKSLKVENVFRFELYPVPTLMFDGTGNMSSEKSASSFSDISKKYRFGK